MRAAKCIKHRAAHAATYYALEEHLDHLQHIVYIVKHRIKNGYHVVKIDRVVHAVHQYYRTPLMGQDQ